MDRTQFELWQRYRALARPYWVIQGDRGGHRRRFDHAEKLLIYMETGRQDVEPAAPGDLPYAAPDERVIAQLEQKDLLRKYGKILTFAAYNPDQFNDLEMQEVIKIREKLWSHLSTQVEDAISSLAKTTLRRAADEIFDNRHTPIVDTDFQREIEIHHEQFVREGSMI